MISKKLLLHTCCAPCMGYVYELLKDEFIVTAYFSNPNIMPAEEYRIRYVELESYSRLKGFQLITEIPDTKKWVKEIKDFRYYGEGSERCWKCYEIRLENSFKKAVELGFDIVATTLSISPHKNAAKINEIGERLSREYGIEFYSADFKKNDGVRKSVEISKMNNFYRQNYCGCIYSKLEKNSKSRWSEKAREFRLKSLSSLNPDEDVSAFTLGKEIDLHHFHPSDTAILIEKFLENAVKEKYKTVRIIHGKGKSVKKRQIHEILKSHPSVIIFHDDSGNWGATVITLKV
ncbi:MAG TPA: epoxyqueuosine reductase QueH [Spirochaetota bacterium]|nr:epoxyqueuosine reductase QueH [Spirochaetota bacterium]HPS86349.1 epoxyqueuosine reductase QueH [Spirochaetota bacterium]